MKERPILFSAPMVRATLDGRKKQTRRIAVKTSQPRSVYVTDFDAEEFKIEIENKHSGHRYWKQCPYGIPGDRLWVREAHSIRVEPSNLSAGHAWYRESDIGRQWNGEIRWRPSIHMPRWASRILLEVTGVRVERLQDISEADAVAEGVTNSLHLPGGRLAKENFEHLWWTINGDGSWESNPWVWVVEFKRLEGGAA